VLAAALHGQVSQPVNPPQQFVSVAHLTPREVREGSAKVIAAYDPAQHLRVSFGLKPSHPDELKQLIEELHDPNSPNFMKFLTPAETIARFSPTAADEQAVVDWAQSQGLTVTHRFPNRLLVDVDAPVAAIQRAFHLSVNRYQIGNATYFSNDRDPVIPAALSNIVESVAGLNNIQVFRPMNPHMQEPTFPEYSAGPPVTNAAKGGSSADAASAKAYLNKLHSGGLTPNITSGAYDPTDMFSSQAYDTQALYNQGHCCNVTGHPGGSPPESSIAIATAGTQDPNDFAGFHNQYPYLAYHYFLIYIDGTPSCCDGEGTMDFEWSTAMSNSFGSLYNTSSVFMYDGVDNGWYTFNDIYNQMLTDGNARVMSTSWGWVENDVTSLMNTTDNIFGQMIVQGWTLLAASGDGGATYGCRSYDAISYPSSDPNVVAAGGVTLYLNSNSAFNSMVAWSGGPYGCSTNDGGSTGGVSVFWPAPSYQGLPNGWNREVPDIALNADWANTPQNYYFGGSLSGNGGTSIVAPEMAGFFANANAYLDYIGTLTGGCYGGHSCAPIGNGNWYLYYFGEHPGYAPHYPFYDVTLGCNNNDITAEFGLPYFCAGSGYDMVTGWGVPNMLQLSWAINTYRAGDFGAPVASFSGPATNTWYKADQVISWTLTDTSENGNPATGVAGFSSAWDSDPGNVTSEAHPGAGNSFYSGPQFPNATSGALHLSGTWQGCHTVNVRAWDNTGVASNDLTYGPVCYDTVPPITSLAVSPGPNSAGWEKSSVTVTLGASDPGGAGHSSGVAATYFSVDNASCSPSTLAACAVYTKPFSITTQAKHSVRFFSRDRAGNFGAVQLAGINIDETAPHTVATLTGTKLGSTYLPGMKVTLSATDNLSGVSSTTYQLDNGAVTAYKTPITVSNVGAHKITFHSVDNAGNTETSETATFVVAKANSSITVASSLNPSTKGKAVTFTATVSATGATLTGWVQFKDGNTILNIGGVNSTTHKASYTTSALATGTHSITAVYTGSLYFNPSTSAVLKQVVNP
jgi:hypothetical protein